MAMYDSGYVSISAGLRLTLLPPIGTIDIDSTPPPITTSAKPAWTCSPACTMACKPLAQKRLTVSPGALFGNLATNTAFRAMLRPCSASGIAQPSTTSCTSSGRSPGTLATAACIAQAARSSGRVWRRVPLRARPTAVRTLLAITTFSGKAMLVPQGLVVHEHVTDAVERLLLAAQRQERFALQIEVVLIRHLGARRDEATAQHVGELVGDQRVVLRRVAAFDHGPDASADRLGGVVASGAVEAGTRGAIAGAGQAERAPLGAVQELAPVEAHPVRRP